MILSLLIANRGEIACRTIRTAREMGVRRVAIHSGPDTDWLNAPIPERALRRVQDVMR